MVWDGGVVGVTEEATLIFLPCKEAAEGNEVHTLPEAWRNQQVDLVALKQHSRFMSLWDKYFPCDCINRKKL